MSSRQKKVGGKTMYRRIAAVAIAAIIAIAAVISFGAVYGSCVAAEAEIFKRTHTSYYIGSLALAKDGNGNSLNYLAPKKKFDKITTR